LKPIRLRDERNNLRFRFSPVFGDVPTSVETMQGYVSRFVGTRGEFIFCRMAGRNAIVASAEVPTAGARIQYAQSNPLANESLNETGKRQQRVEWPETLATRATSYIMACLFSGIRSQVGN
jgi:hypothetical protein